MSNAFRFRSDAVLGVPLQADHEWAWLIQGFDGLNLLFKFKLSRAMSEREVETMLQRLASRDLTASEVVNASKRKGMTTYASHLEVLKERSPRLVLSIGNNPHYVASTHTASEFQAMGAL